CGGDSPEREVSLRSGKSVLQALQAAGYTTQEYDPAKGIKFLDSLGPATIVFPILHGQGGEDGTIQKQLEKRNIKYLGSDSRASALCFDKSRTRQVLLANGVPMAEGDTVTRDSYTDHPLTKRPHVLKVARGGSSIGTLLVSNPTVSKPEKVQEIFELDELAIIEELVEGVEIKITILDRTALPVIEIRPPADGEFDYENKYNGQTAELCPP